MDIGDYKRTIIIEPLENPVPQKEPRHSQGEQALIEQERLILDATELVYELMDAEGVNQKDLAKRLGKSKGFVSQVLSGKRNMTLRTLADLLRVLGYRARFQTARLSEPFVPSRALGNAVFLDDAWWTSMAHRTWSHVRSRPHGDEESAFGIVQFKHSGWLAGARRGEPASYWDLFIDAHEEAQGDGTDDEPATGTYELVG